MLVQGPFLEDQVKVALLPTVYHYEASLAVPNTDPARPRGGRAREIDPRTLRNVGQWPCSSTVKKRFNVDAGAGWVPIFISVCSLDEDASQLDNFIHLTKPIKRVNEKKDFRRTFALSISLERIVDTFQETCQAANYVKVKKCFILAEIAYRESHQHFPHIVIKFHKMTVVQPSKDALPSSFGVANSVRECPDYLILVAKHPHVQREISSLDAHVAEWQSIDISMQFQSVFREVQHRSEILKRLEVLTANNRAVKSALWKSMNCFKVLVREIEDSFETVRRFTNQILYPRKPRTEAQLAAVVGLEESHPLVKKPRKISRKHALLMIRYGRLTIRLLTVMIFDTEQIVSRDKLFQKLSTYGYKELIKSKYYSWGPFDDVFEQVLIAGLSLECLLRGPAVKADSVEVSIPPAQKLVGSPHVQGLAKLLNDFHVLPRADTLQKSVSISETESSTSTLEPPTPASAWASTPFRILPGSKMRRRSIVETSKAFASFPHAFETLSQSNATSASSFNTFSQTSSETLASRSGYRRSRLTGAVSQELHEPARLCPDMAENQSTSNTGGAIAYLGHFGRVDLWNAQWHTRTKSAFGLQDKITRDAARARDMRANTAAAEINATSQQKPAKAVTFDCILDKTMLLALPVPPLPADRPTTIGPWLSDTDDDDDGFDAKVLDLICSDKNSSSAYPTPRQFECVDMSPNQPSLEALKVHEEFRLCAVDSTVLLWELGFTARKHESAALVFDNLMVAHWLPKDRAEICGWFPNFGGLSSCIHLIVSILNSCNDLNDSPEFIAEQSSEGAGEVTLQNSTISKFSELLNPSLLANLYRVVLLVNHVLLDLSSAKSVFQSLKSEFKYELTRKAIWSRFGHDPRSISQAVFVELGRLVDGYEEAVAGGL
ncbi:hypothetical protein HDU82_004961 [Entophlyctis luteolus]|nr:hypothetical protein HDU82_004961 [Entophlyctis luteolus]